MNAHQASVFTTLINNDPEIQAKTSCAVAGKVELMTTELGSERNLALREEVGRLDADINQRKDEHEQTARATL